MLYRVLRAGEIIEAGDQTDRCADPWRDSAKWEPVHPNDIGTPAPDPSYPSHRIFRRIAKAEMIDMKTTTTETKDGQTTITTRKWNRVETRTFGGVRSGRHVASEHVPLCREMKSDDWTVEG